MNPIGRFLRRHPRLLQFLCRHETSNYVGRCLRANGDVEEELPVYECSTCGLLRIGDSYRFNPFGENSSTERNDETRKSWKSVVRRRKYVTIPLKGWDKDDF